MGGWHEIDAVTHTPIWEGDPVVMVELTPKGARNSWWCGPDFLLPEHLVQIHKGTYNGQGWLKEVPYQEESRPDRHSVFFHKITWDLIVEKYPVKPAPLALSKYHWESCELPNHLEELNIVMEFAITCKLHLNTGLPYKGSQFERYRDQVGYTFFRELHTINMKRMDAHHVEMGGTLEDHND